MKRLILSVFVCVVSCCLLVPQATAAGKPDTLYIGVLADMSGPYAPVVGSFRPGYIDACKYVNEKMGGIKGVPMNPLIRDNGGKVAVSLAQYNELINRKPRPVFIDTAFSPVAEALRPRYVEDDMIGIHAGNIVAVYPRANSYAYYPMYDEWFGVSAKWFKDNWKEKRAPRLAFLTWDSSYGKAILEPTVYEYAKSKGVEIVATELFGLRDVSVTNQMMKIRAQKADWIYTNSLAHGPVLVAKAAKEIGYQVGLAGGMGFDNVCLALGKDLMEGFVGIHGASHWNETGTEGVQLMDKYMQKNKRPEKYKTSTYPISWAAVIIFSEIMERTVDKYGWDGLTGPNIKKEMEGLKNFKILKDLWLYSYSSTQRSPRHGKVFQVKNGKIVPITPFQEMPDTRAAEFK